MHHGSSRSEGGQDSDSEAGNDSPFDEHSARFQNLTQRQVSEISRESLNLPLWKNVDNDLKAVIEKYLIDFQRLSIGKIIGKGETIYLFSEVRQMVNWYSVMFDPHLASVL